MNRRAVIQKLLRILDLQDQIKELCREVEPYIAGDETLRLLWQETGCQDILYP